MRMRCKHIFFAVVAVLLLVGIGSASAPARAADAPDQQVLVRIEHVVNADRPPPFLSYTMTRVTEIGDNKVPGQDDYTYRIWLRTGDHAALGVEQSDRVFKKLTFLRPAMYEFGDPSPLGSDIFREAKEYPEATPEAVGPIPVARFAASAYRVTALTNIDKYLVITLEPRTDPRRFPLRKLVVDSGTLQIVRAVAVDRMFNIGERSLAFGLVTTIDLETIEGHTLITKILAQHFTDDRVDFQMVTTFEHVKAYSAMPDWYFNPAIYGAHAAAELN